MTYAQKRFIYKAKLGVLGKKSSSFKLFELRKLGANLKITFSVYFKKDYSYSL